MRKMHERWKHLATLIRKWSLIATTEAGSGHPTSSLSAADIGAVLFDTFFTYDIDDPHHPNNDRFVLSKGHATPLLYTLFALAGAMPLEELKTLRRFGSPLEGHPTPNFPYVDAATGSLGQGLSIGAGLAYGIRAGISNLPRVYVMLGDGECAEGNVWEAANFASYYKLNNLIAIVDVNRFGQSQETMFGHDLSEYVQRFSAFGWEVIAIDGHNFSEIEKAFVFAVHNKSESPFAIVAKTKKGEGVSFLEDKDGWHGKAASKEELAKALVELGPVDDILRFTLRPPQQTARRTRRQPRNVDVFLGLPYKRNDKIATREVYGEVLGKLASKNPLIFALDGDVKNSTFSQDFKKYHPSRFIECFIAEQNMVGVALGLSAQGKVPFVSTFASFFTRAFDQIRMGAISRSNIKFIGSHAGVSIGEDGPSQMGLEDVAMFATIPDSVILHPADAVSAAKLLSVMATHKGISYLRTLRPKTPVLYDTKEEFSIGGSKILRQSRKDLLTVVAAGITVHEALSAYDTLKQERVSIRVVDCYSVKPVDVRTLTRCLLATKKKIIIVVEDHYEHGGLGDLVTSALAIEGVEARFIKMAVSAIPRSGTKEQLLDFAGIASSHIVAKVKSLI